MAGNTAEVEPMAFINGALRFAWAADELQKLLKAVHDPHDDPVYLLMAHAIELALKGYLRLHGWSTLTLARPPYGHNLRELYRECEQLGLPLHGDRSSARDVVRMLDDSNEDQGLRYFILKSQTFPEVRWGVEVVHGIVDAARRAAVMVNPDAEKPGPVVKFNFTIGEPHEQP
jgi:hypothetical protein